MDGRLVPPLAFASRPLLRDLVTNVATVQLGHRLIAGVLLLLVPAFAWTVWLRAS